MRLSKKIEGFTLMEMLIALILTSIIVSFAYWGFSSIFSSFTEYQKINRQVSEHTDFCREINNLLYKSQYILKNEDNIMFFEKDKETFRAENTGKELVLKYDNRVIDSLHVKIEKVEFYWQKELQTGNGPINSIIFNVKFYDKTFNLTFEKTYDSFTLMHLDSLQKVNHLE